MGRTDPGNRSVGPPSPSFLRLPPSPPSFLRQPPPSPPHFLPPPLPHPLPHSFPHWGPRPQDLQEDQVRLLQRPDRNLHHHPLRELPLRKGRLQLPLRLPQDPQVRPSPPPHLWLQEDLRTLLSFKLEVPFPVVYSM